MIRAAHVGVGVLGKEGMQAAMASDFNIAKFRCVPLFRLFSAKKKIA